jgi:hypothetical protein
MEEAFKFVEGSTIFFFIGLFILVAGLVETGVIGKLAVGAISLTKGNGVIKKIRDFFDHNDTYTDVMFNIYANYEYQVFVRKDFYTDFILALMKYQLLEKVEWKK